MLGRLPTQTTVLGRVRHIGNHFQRSLRMTMPDGGNTAERIRALEAENARLREALQKIYDQIIAQQLIPSRAASAPKQDADMRGLTWEEATELRMERGRAPGGTEKKHG